VRSKESTSPKTAKAGTNGGTMSVRVRHTKGGKFTYKLKVDYVCP